MTILVIEDILEQRQALVKFIERNFLDIKVYSSDSVRKSNSILLNKDIDLFFIDIKLKDGSGLELAKKIREYSKYKLTPIIFVTTETMHIIRALKEIHCYDFLIKPYKESDVRDIINLFSSKSFDENFCFIKINHNYTIKVNLKDIIFVEYSLRKCIIHTLDGEIIIKNTSLCNLLKQLNCDHIIKCHKSYAVNLSYIETIEKCGLKSWAIRFKNYDKQAFLSYKFKNLFKEAF